MSIILSQSLVLNPGAEQLNTPVFGFNNLLSIASVTATTEATDFPVTNLANPSTAQRWKASDSISPFPATEFITSTFEIAQDLDYLAIAVHNLGTIQSTVSVEYLDVDASPDTWTELIGEHILSNDDPVIFRFTKTSIGSIRLKIQGSPLSPPSPPFIAVMYVGKLLVIPRGTHTDHTPINLNIQSKVMTGKSETGNFLGRVILSEQRATSIAFNRLDANFYRSNIQPFIIAAKDTPFFFGWKPQEFSNDVGYCWLTNDPQPSRHFDTATMSITLQMSGIAI